jgi:hypothetical protein
MGIGPTDIEDPLTNGVASYDVFVLNNDTHQISSVIKNECIGPTGIFTAFFMRFRFACLITDCYNTVRVLLSTNTVPFC